MHIADKIDFKTKTLTSDEEGLSNPTPGSLSEEDETLR